MTDPKTLARTNDPQTSKDAAKRMVDSGELSRQEKLVYKTIKGYIRSHEEDFTTKNIAMWMLPMPYYKAYDICRRRFSGLANKGKIEPIETGIILGTRKIVYDRRDGCRVYRLL